MFPRRAARQAAERLRRCAAELPVPTDAGPVAVTISPGVAAPAGGAANLAGLLNQADEALLRAKRGGRNRVEMART
ncbi:MAG: diguanylate cyclase [Chloroflexi bacterium]|nr:diguanylate cyclase [Chloroflexota bacterium]